MHKLYDSLAEWWPLVSHPSEYEEEAAIYRSILKGKGTDPCKTLAEFGSGGGNNASYLKHDFEMTLVDVAPRMLDVSLQLNPECEHVCGDLRTVRLGRQFDRVFVHDAICYMVTEEDLRLAAATAFVHCRAGGAALFCPDQVKENFRESTSEGGNNGPERSARFLEWSWDPDPADCTYTVDYAFLLRDATGSVRVEHDRHIEGLFSRKDWLRVLQQAGFSEVEVVPLEHPEVEPGTVEMFVGLRPANGDRV